MEGAELQCWVGFKRSCLQGNVFLSSSKNMPRSLLAGAEALWGPATFDDELYARAKPCARIWA